jgi:hypothetical protein
MKRILIVIGQQTIIHFHFINFFDFWFVIYYKFHGYFIVIMFTSLALHQFHVCFIIVFTFSVLICNCSYVYERECKFWTNGKIQC